MSSKDRVEKAVTDTFCSSCGSSIQEDAEICPECGVRQANPTAAKNPAIAAIASFLIVGVGQVYNGELVRGLALFVAMSVCSTLALFFFWLIIPAVLPFAVWGFAVYDAHKRAKLINAGELSV